MSILYTIICRGYNIVLCKYTDYQGNFEQISRNILQRVEQDTRGTFNYANDYFFHYINSTGLTFMCMCNTNLNQDRGFLYLEDIKTLFLKTFPRIQINAANAYSQNENFQEIIREKMIAYNANLNERESVGFSQIRMPENEDNLLSSKLIKMKADNLKQVYDRSKLTMSTILNLKKENNSNKRKKQIFKYLIYLLIIGFFGYLISVIVCGWDYSRCT